MPPADNITPPAKDSSPFLRFGSTGAAAAALLLAGLLVAACAGPEYVAEHPVANEVPPLQVGVFTAAQVDVRPESTHEVEPEFPYKLGSVLSGSAVVAFTVTTDGKVKDPLVVKADDVLYGEAAVAAVVKWRFRPAQIKGAAVNCRLTLPFVFDSPYGYTSGEGGPNPPARRPKDEATQTEIKAGR